MGTQLDLFGDRTLRLAPAHRALEGFDLDTARRELRTLAALYPHDDEIRRELSGVDLLFERIGALSAEHEDPLRGLMALGAELPGSRERAWRRRFATELEARLGPGANFAGEPAGLHYLLAGDLADAERSLRATLDRYPDDARARAYLGDVLFRSGHVERSRLEYLRAFTSSAGSVSLDSVADPDVAALATAASYEYEVPGEVADWIAPVGTVAAVFPWPPVELPGLAPALHEAVETSALLVAPGKAFHRLMIAERSGRTLDERVVYRRVMKKLCPLLFDAYLARR